MQQINVAKCCQLKMANGFYSGNNAAMLFAIDHSFREIFIFWKHPVHFCTFHPRTICWACRVGCFQSQDHIAIPTMPLAWAHVVAVEHHLHLMRRLADSLWPVWQGDPKVVMGLSKFKGFFFPTLVVFFITVAVWMLCNWINLDPSNTLL